MDKSKFYLDLSKCTEEEQKHIISLLPVPKDDDLYEISDDYYILTYHYFKDWEWIVGVESFKDDKTELTYPEFIKMFDGGEGENNGWTKIESESDLPPYNKWVIAYTKDGGNHIAYFNERRSEWVANSKFGDEITHWRHQPEPPKS